MTEPDFRAIRVFVSSTFRDMQAEREELIKRVFPQLRRMCERRGVAWSEVDLRWGVTDEQKAEGAVLPICLAEIDRSRPYFIGLLGQRYGWVPDEMPSGLVDQLPWLSHLSGTSVTEMEILHGVLNDPASAGHAFFYLRDPAWVAGRPIDEQAVLRESASDDEIAALGADAAEAAAGARRLRLEELKRAVTVAGLPSWQYPDPQALGARVLTDFTALIDRLYPEADTPDALGRDADTHRAFGSAQLLGHVVRPTLNAQLDTFATSNNPPLLVTGEVGAGANEVVTGWLHEWRDTHPDDVIVEHHVGANASAAEWTSMADRVARSIARSHGFEDSLVEGTDASTSRAALWDALSRAGRATRRTVVVVTGADLLTDVDGAPDLTWLPKQGAATVRIVMTSNGGRPATEMQRRGWPAMSVPALDEAERRELIRSFLGRYSKGLDEVHVARLVAVPATGNSLFLRTVLDELRQHGDHFTLGQVIDHHLGATTVGALLGLVLARYEADFETDRPGLVGDAMRALWAARRGLSESELFDLLGTNGEPLPGAVWSPLVLAAEAGLVTRSGQLAFATESHRLAVERRYLANDDARRGAHAALARLFAAAPLGPRVVDELPWQQLGAGDMDGLVATLSDLAFLDVAYQRSHSDVRRLWRRAEEAGRRVVDGYRAIVDDPSCNAEMAWEVARLVTDAGYPTEAARMNRFLVDHYRSRVAADAGDDVAARRLPAAFVNTGAALFAQGDLAAAEPYLREGVELARSRPEAHVLQAGLGNLALLRRDLGDTAGALVLFAEEEALCRSRGDTNGLQGSLGNRSQVLRQAGDLEGALVLMREQEELCRSVGDSAGVARALAGQGAVLADRGNPADALSRFTEYRRVANELGDLRAVVEAGISEADTLRQLGRRDEAARLAAETEALARRLSDEPLLSRVLDAQARTAVDEGRWADGQHLATEAVLTARSCGARHAEMMALGMLGISNRELGNHAAARSTHNDELSLAHQLGDVGGVATAQVNLAACDIVANDLQSALHRYAQAEPALRHVGANMTLVPLYNNRWQVHAHMGNMPAAIDDLVAGGRAAAACGELQQSQEMLTKAVETLYATGRVNEAEPLWGNVADVARALGDENALQRALGERALMVLGRGDIAAAAGLFDEQEEICRRIGDQVGLAACVGNRAILLRQTGDLVGALRCIDEQLEIAKASGNGQGYLFATANRGEVLGAMGRMAEGLQALGEARTMAANHGLTPMVQQLDQMIAALRGGQQ